MVVTMGRLDAEAKTTMTFLLRKGQSKSEVARLLGVTEGTVRYNAKHKAAGAVDGRSKQKSKLEPSATLAMPCSSMRKTASWFEPPFINFSH